MDPAIGDRGAGAVRADVRPTGGIPVTPSLPCGVCGRVDDLETITPSGIHMDRLVQWECSCRNTRMVEIDYRLPAATVRRAILRDEMRGRIDRHLRRSTA